VWPDFLASDVKSSKFILAFEEIGPFDPFDYAQGRLRSGQALIGFELGLFGFVFLGLKAVSFS